MCVCVGRVHRAKFFEEVCFVGLGNGFDTGGVVSGV